MSHFPNLKIADSAMKNCVPMFIAMSLLMFPAVAQANVIVGNYGNVLFVVGDANHDVIYIHNDGQDIRVEALQFDSNVYQTVTNQDYTITPDGLGASDPESTVFTVDQTMTSSVVHRIVVMGFAGDDTIATTVAVPVSLDGGDGADSLYAFYSPSAGISGGGGSDRLETFDCDASRVLGGSGDDDVYIGGGTFAYVEGGSEDDTIEIKATPIEAYGDGGNDTMSCIDFAFGSSLNLAIDCFFDGGAGNDQLSAGPATTATLNGGPDNDTLIGGMAADVLHGGDGDDDLIGSYDTRDRSLVNDGAVDVMTGGPGSDTFYSRFVTYRYEYRVYNIRNRSLKRRVRVTEVVAEDQITDLDEINDLEIDTEVQ